MNIVRFQPVSISCLSAIILFSIAPISWSQPVSTATITLDQILRTAEANNPEIRAAQKRWDAAKAKIGVENAWEKPQITYERMYSGDEKVFGVSQEIPFPGKLALKGQVASKEAAMAEQDFRAKAIEVRSKAKAAYAMYFRAVKSLDIFEENIELMRRFSKAAESKYAVGKVSQTDVLRAQIELSKMLNMLVTLNQEKETAQAMLNTLLNLHPQNPLGLPEEPPVLRLRQPLEGLQETALARRPELLGAQAAVERSRKARISSRLEYLPDFMAQYRFRQAANPEMDQTNDVMVGVTVPLWFWKQNRMTRMAAAEEEMNRAEYQAMRNMTLFGVKDLLVKTQTAERLIELYRTSVIPQAEQALRISENAYQSDQATFLELIDVQRNLLQFRIEHYEHMASYEQWAAELERLIGKDLSEVH